MLAAPLRAAQAETPPASTPEGGIEQLGFLVGGTWVGSVVQDGETLTLEETCTWSEQNDKIDTSVVVKSGGEVVESAKGGFGWCPTEEKLLSYANAASGALEFGEQNPDCPTGWTFKVHTVGVSVVETEVVMEHSDDDKLTLTTSQGGSEVQKVVYERRTAAPPP